VARRTNHSEKGQSHEHRAQFITHRRMQRDPHTGHVHVGWVQLRGGQTLTRDEVFGWMQRGVRFATLSPHGLSAEVVRVHCRSGRHDYLRTDRDLNIEDNLDELPPF
jgi:Protein of unknown function (DUF3892)